MNNSNYNLKEHVSSKKNSAESFIGTKSGCSVVAPPSETLELLDWMSATALGFSEVQTAKCNLNIGRFVSEYLVIQTTASGPMAEPIT